MMKGKPGTEIRSGSELAAYLSRLALPFSTEAALQAELRNRLRADGIPFKRECVLSPQDRVDFFVPVGGGPDGIAVECKIASSDADVYRQLARYARHVQVQELILVTSRARPQFPREIEGKPVFVVALARAWL